MTTKRKPTKKAKTDTAKQKKSVAGAPRASARRAPRAKDAAAPASEQVAFDQDQDQPAKSEEANVGETAPDAAKDDAAKPRARSGKHRRWPLAVALSVAAVIVAAASVFSWDRWLRYDDAAEFAGEWNVVDTAKVVVIDGQAIKLTEDVSYSYTLDTGAKTISFTFGSLDGQGRYRFSADRTQLVIMDGQDYSWFSTLMDDIGWMWGDVVRAVQGQPPAGPPSGDAVTALSRISHNAAAEPRIDPALAPAEDAAAPQEAPADSASGQEGQKDASDAEGAAGQAGAVDGSASASGGSGSTDADGGAQGSDAGASSNQPDASGGTGAGSTPGSLFDVSDV